jgi:hypothetical protein
MPPAVFKKITQTNLKKMGIARFDRQTGKVIYKNPYMRGRTERIFKSFAEYKKFKPKLK